MQTSLLWLAWIFQHERRIFSQNKEDGVLQYIFQNIGTTDKYFVEFGVESGKERNTRYLQTFRGWKGLLMDGGYENDRINLHKEFINSTNILSLFEKYEVPKEFDLLSVDIDSCDLWVWKKIATVHRPRVLVIEFNSNFKLYNYWTFPDDSQERWLWDTQMVRECTSIINFIPSFSSQAIYVLCI